MNRIELYTDNGMWMARFSGPHSALIMRLFGTVEVPTSYTSGAKWNVVLDVVRRFNPEAIVTMEATQ